ncbi:MAG: hypothetical protein AB7H93_09880 [Vicinamibacterales bacterium]
MRASSVVLGVALLGATALAQDDEYLRWDGTRATAIVATAHSDGKVGSRTLLFWTGWDSRRLKTERAQNYKLRATWFTPDVVRASARWAQLRSRLSDDQTRQLVEEAEKAGDTVVVVDIDPNEGSGVIPTDWEAFLRPKDAPSESGQFARGIVAEELRKVRALQPIAQRNYDYDRFWVVFPLKTDDGRPLFGASDSQAELLVRIYNREGTVTWPIRSDVRARFTEQSRP